VEKKLKGRRGGAPMASQVAGGEQVGHVERGNLGARAAARGVSGGGLRQDLGLEGERRLAIGLARGIGPIHQ
jgi:hypothetical protein